MSDDTGKVVVPIVALIVALLAVGWLTLPFEGGGKVDCRVRLAGDGKPTRDVSAFAITDKEARSCRDGGRSRAVSAALVALLALAASGAAVLLPPEDERDWPASWFGVSPGSSP